MTATLTVSIVALVVSASVAAWNVLQYVLNGGRVRVQLRLGRLDDQALTASSFRFGFNPGVARLSHGGPIYLDVGVLRVENLGRTGVTIEDASFDLGGRWNWKRLRYERRTARSTLLRFGDSKTDNVVRIEPYDFVDYVLDAEAAITGASRAGDAKLRGSVYVAGKRLRRRSSRRQAWRIKKGSRTVSGEGLSVEEVVFRELVRQKFRHPEPDHFWDPDFYADRFAREWERRGGGSRLSDVIAVLKEIDARGSGWQLATKSSPIARGLGLHGHLNSEQAETDDVQSPRPDPEPRADTEEPRPEWSDPSDP